MAFRGELQKLPLFDVLQMVATTGKSGRLVLSRRSARGLVVFRDGRIVYAASESLRETLGSLLVSLGLVEEARLREALELQGEREPSVRLGQILVENEWLSEEDLEAAVTRQVERVIAELASWKKGYFEFTQMRVPSRGEVAVDARELLLEPGLAADHVLLSIAVKLDEARRDAGDDEAEAPEGLFDLAGLTETGAASEPSADPRVAAMKSVLSQVRSPRLTGEVAEVVLSNAARLVRRAVLFAVHSEVFRGLGQRGLEGPVAEEIGELKIPLSEGGLLYRAAASREVARGTLSSEAGDELLLAGLGGDPPAEAIAAPMAVGERIGLVVYGDNLPAAEPVGSTDELELVLLQTGMAMERAALEERVKQLEFDEILKSRG